MSIFCPFCGGHIEEAFPIPRCWKCAERSAPLQMGQVFGTGTGKAAQGIDLRGAGILEGEAFNPLFNKPSPHNTSTTPDPDKTES